MKRVLLLATVLASLTGCSNAPVAGFMDSCFPSRGVKAGPPAGGVPGGIVPDVRPTNEVLPPPRTP